ncbi:hypothetical protein FAI40_04945 [Acetobacteraceae bacterium]|nr:hypothetical protein FAI40_04945 [Acetobacteraceae bacterium]
MDELTIIVCCCLAASSIGFLLTAFMFVVLSLAPQGRFSVLLTTFLLFLLEADWISIWFLFLFFVANGFTSSFSLNLVFGILLFGMSLPILWVVRARIGIARKKIRPVVLSLKKLEFEDASGQK